MPIQSSAEYHKTDIGFVQIGKQQSGNQNGKYDDDASHRWCSFFLLFPFQSKFANAFTHLKIPEVVDQSSSEQHGYHQ